MCAYRCVCWDWEKRRQEIRLLSKANWKAANISVHLMCRRNFASEVIIWNENLYLVRNFVPAGRWFNAFFPKQYFVLKKRNLFTQIFLAEMKNNYIWLPPKGKSKLDQYYWAASPTEKKHGTTQKALRVPPPASPFPCDVDDHLTFEGKGLVVSDIKQQVWNENKILALTCESLKSFIFRRHTLIGHQKKKNKQIKNCYVIILKN